MHLFRVEENWRKIRGDSMEESIKRYIGITIGPIDRVAGMAKRGTKALWASSYIFSYLAREIVRKFYLEKERNFLLPQWSQQGAEPDSTVFDTKNGSGLFPDRYIFKSEGNDFKDLQAHKEKVLGELAKKLGEELSVPDLEKVKKYVNNNFKVFFVEQKFNPDDTDGKVVEDISSMLDILESEDIFCGETLDKDNYLERLFEKADSFLMKDAFGEKEKSNDKRIIKTIFEYTACELKEEEYWKECGFQEPPTIDLAGKQGNPFVENVDDKVKKKYLPYHNYLAVVKADGDRMGDTLKNMAKMGIPIYKLDKNLLQYNLSVGEKIRKQGGVPVFLGGDDLLFFAPVIGLGHKTVFNLIDEIDATFHKQMEDLKDLLKDGMKMTLSFGMSISYYKFPIYEARRMAEELLYKAKDSGRNGLAWQLRKHSGQVIDGGVINKGKGSFYSEYKKLIVDNCKIQVSEDENKLYSSFVYWLNEHASVIKGILSDNNKLVNYFKNSFEKPFYDNAGFKGLYEKVLKMMSENSGDGYIIESMYSALRFILFVKNCE